MSTSQKPLSIPQLIKAVSIHLMEGHLRDVRLLCSSDAQFETAKTSVVQRTHTTLLEAFQQLQAEGYVKKCLHCENGAVKIAKKMESKPEEVACGECHGIGLVNSIVRINERFVRKGTTEEIPDGELREMFANKAVGDES